MSVLTATDLDRVKNFPQLVELLRDKLEWPINDEYDFDDVVFEYEASELGLKKEEVAKIREIHQLRPLVTGQPWGVFFISLEDKEVPVTVLRRILKALILNRRGQSKTPDRQAWHLNDLIFAASFGRSGARELAFIHFSDAKKTGDLPVMKVLGWNAQDTALKHAYVAETLRGKLAWPDDTSNVEAWRSAWSSAFELRLNETIRTSKDLAVRLAGLASDIRARVNQLLAVEDETGPMRAMLSAFRKNLIHDLDEDGFADMFAQTITYGMLAARISRPMGIVADNLADMVPRTNPFLKELFGSFLKIGGRDKRQGMDFDELGVRDVVDVLNEANMEAVLRDFGDRNPKEDPVIHFYELFLKEYDPQKRMQRGVFYTPRPVVNFIVRGVDEILQTEFGLPLGLADTSTWAEVAARNARITIPAHVKPDAPFVQILDPATGTGTFLVEVIDLIHKRMEDHWINLGRSKDEIKAAWNAYVPAHLLPRLTAFELMMAPFTIAHMKVGLKLSETGYAFGSDERARIFLTNALEPARDMDMAFVFMSEALAHEAQAANEAKARSPFTVVIGNPPYAGHSKNNNIPEIVRLVHDYKKDWPDLLKPGQGKWLQDDYVKFIRLAQFKLDRTGLGILGFISNHAFYDNPTFKGMRSNLKASFGQIRVLDLHGNVNKKEKSPDGSADEGVFEEVAQGVAITQAIKLPGFDPKEQLWRDDLFGLVSKKLDYLVAPSARITGQIKCPIFPPEAFFFGVDSLMKVEWQNFSSLPQIMGENGDPAPGIVTTHDEYAISFTREEQIEKVDWLINTPNEEAARQRLKLCSQEQWSYGVAKRELLRRDWRKEVTPLVYRPFDTRFTVYNKHVAVHLRDRVMRHMTGGLENVGIVTVRQVAEGIFNHAFCADSIVESRITLSNKGIGFLMPLWLNPSAGEAHRRPNVDRGWAKVSEKELGLTYQDGIPRALEKSLDPDFHRPKVEHLGLIDRPWDGRGDLRKTFGPRDLFDYIYAVMHSPAYRSRYAEFLKSDFPRIPTPKDRVTFADLVPLGRALLALHLLRSEEAPILQNPTVRFTGSGEARVAKGFPQFRNGRVFINETRWFEDVPKETWEFQVGGYQVCEKWLKDRAGKGGKNPGPGRVLTDEDLLHYRRTVTALTETRRLMTEIDQVIHKHGGWPGAFYQPPPPPPSVEEIIGADESRGLEFKSTFEWDLRERKQNKALQKEVLKTLAAFMNTDGGTLVIGVTDDKQIIGLGNDLKLVKDSLDLFENKLMSVFSSAIGAPYSLHCKLRFADAREGKKVCVIDVAASKEPVFVDFQSEHSFFIRRGNGTSSLNASEQHVYIRQRFAD
jgi:Type ISP C-terminal specificity domain/Putative DNA-binding domain